MKVQKRLTHRRHHDWEPFDKIEMSIVPRYKTSGLSGDEWRHGWSVKLFFKGLLVEQLSFTRLHHVLQLLGSHVDRLTSPLPQSLLDVEGRKCDQVGCDQDWVARFTFKRIYTPRGEKLDATEQEHCTYYAKFCKRHLRRGDCGLEDADSNYEALDGVGPDESTNLTESPAVFGGVIGGKP